MFDRTRRKIVFNVVFSLIVLMAVTLATIYVSNRAVLQSENEELLKKYADRFSPEELPPPDHDNGKPGQIPGNGIPENGIPENAAPENRQDISGGMPGDRNGEPDKDEPRFQLSTFYSVAYSPDGQIISVKNGNDFLKSEEELKNTAAAILKKGKTSGKTGNISYLVVEREDYTLVAMIDGTINSDNQSLLFRQMLIIGSAALAVLIVIAVFTARRIVRPLEENDIRQKRFVSDAGHEFKTPIAVISANSELLRRQIGESEWLDNIDYENERMSDLVKQLLVLSKTESGEEPKEILDFSKLVGGEVLPFESLAFEKGKRIDSSIEEGISVNGNPGHLKQLVSILLDNALSHGTGDTIELNLARERHSAVLTVKNQAPEMSAEQLSHLFDRFYRADETRGQSGSHYGLGLSIAKAITDAHGGQINAAYADGTAVFTFSIPVEK